MKSKPAAKPQRCRVPSERRKKPAPVDGGVNATIFLFFFVCLIDLIRVLLLVINQFI